MGGPIAKKGDTAALTAAFDAGADVDAPDKFATPLYYVVSRQHVDAAEQLVALKPRPVQFSQIG